MLQHFLRVLVRLFKGSPLVRLDQRLSDAETAVTNAEDKAADLAAKVAKMEGRIDPLSTFIQCLEDFHRDGYPRDRSSRHNIEQ